MKPIYQIIVVIVAIMFIATITFFAFGGNSSQVKEVSQENIPLVVSTVETVEQLQSVPTPTNQCVEKGNYLICTYMDVRHPVDNGNISLVSIKEEHPALIVDKATEIKWEAVRGSMSLNDIAFWFGRNNEAWTGAYKEIAYQKIFSYIREYRHGVIVKSATFQKMVYSQNGRIHLAENVSVWDNYRDQKISAYATSFTNNESEITMIFFYRGGDLVSFGYGDSKLVVTKMNFILGSSDSGGGTSGSDGGSYSSDGGSTGSTGDSGSAVGNVPS